MWLRVSERGCLADYVTLAGSGDGGDDTRLAGCAGGDDIRSASA